MLLQTLQETCLDSLFTLEMKKTPTKYGPLRRKKEAQS